MNKKRALDYLPLNQDDIIAVRGKPFAKKVVQYKRFSQTLFLEEWVYLSPSSNEKEYYSFRNGHLSGYKAGND